MSTKMFEKILCVDQPYPPSRLKANIGPLEVSENGIEFRGKKPISISKPFSVTRIKSRAFVNDLLQIDFSKGNSLSTVYFVVPRRGEVAKQLVDQMQAALKGIASTSQADGSAHEHAQIEALEVHRQSQLEHEAMRGRLDVILGAVLVCISLTILLIKEGKLIQFWLPGILFGVGILLKGVSRKVNEKK